MGRPLRSLRFDGATADAKPSVLDRFWKEWAKSTS